MELQLSGKVAVVTGASKGIGLAIAQALAGEGVEVVAGARGAMADPPDHVHPMAVDLSTSDGPGQLVDTAVRTFGRLDLVVNNVGALRPRTGGFQSLTDDDWRTAWELNFLAAVRTTRAALPHLLAGGGGSIVSIASVNATLPDPLVIDYSAAKSALASFSKSLSKEVGRQGVRVNTVSPGPVSTDLWLGKDGVANTVAQASGGDPDAVAEQAVGASMTGRFTRPDEVADLVVFLASPRSGNVTGADFIIDGGLITTL